MSTRILFLEAKKENKEGTLNYPAIAQAKLPSDIKEPVMMLVPSTEGLPYESMIIDQSLERIPAGGYLLINLSPMEVRGLVGSSQVVVSGGSATAIIPSAGDGDLLDVHF